MAIAIASLVAWVLTALLGSYMLAKYVAAGGHRKPSSSKLPPSVIFGHFALAAVGLVLWFIYVFTDNHPIGWTALALLAPVVVLGFVMFAIGLGTFRSQGTAAAPPDASPDAPEMSFPVTVFTAHGVFAIATIVLGLLAILEVGG
ncbi:MAG: hypothetical protein M3Y83_10495 [Actinomycetota bacterium]|nr:hypothetical protein [Actinomycetota bacterium]